MTDYRSAVSGQCLICSAPNTAIHFGIEACRACASFFKRAQLSGRSFQCRRGDHKCMDQRVDGPMCRGCRLDKCLAIGMQYEGPMRKYYPKCQDGRAPSSSSTQNDESLLARIKREHTACFKRRCVQEQEIVQRHKLTRLLHPTEEIYLASYASALACFNVTVGESWRCFTAIFPFMDTLAIDDQREFFRHCVPQFAMLDCFCRTKQNFGSFAKNSMCSMLLCTDIHHPEHWIGEEIGGSNREELLESVRAYSQDQMTVVVPSFEKADICESEKYALLALLLCESDLSDDFSERFKPFLDDVRSRILYDLHRFYTEDMGLSEYSTRLGNLFTICHTFREGNVLFQEFFRMQVTIFDLVATESMLHDLLI